jgi:hypothetical protein
MRDSNPLMVARMLMERHGLRAAAVAQEYANEAQLSGDTAQLDHWHAVQAAIAEMKREAARPT